MIHAVLQCYTQMRAVASKIEMVQPQNSDGT